MLTEEDKRGFVRDLDGPPLRTPKTYLLEWAESGFLELTFLCGLDNKTLEDLTFGSVVPKYKEMNRYATLDKSCLGETLEV